MGELPGRMCATCDAGTYEKCPDCDAGTYEKCPDCEGRGYAIFNPDRHSAKDHPEYGTCEALYRKLTREEAVEKLEQFKKVNPGKTYVIRVWPSGALGPSGEEVG